MFQYITPNKAIMGLVFAPIFYYILTFFIPANTLRETFNSLSFGAYIVISGTWLMAFFAAVKFGGHGGKWRLILGVFVLAMTVTNTRVYNSLYNLYGRPDSWSNSAWPGFWSYSFFVAGLLILSAAFDDKDGPIVRLVPMLIAAALGGAAATAALIYGVSSVG